MGILREYSQRTFSSLSIRNYRLYFFGQGFSLVGNWMQIVALGWLVILLTDSGTQLGIVIALLHLPMLLLGPWGGVIVDRFPKRRLLYCTQTLLGGFAFLISTLVYFERIEMWMLYMIALIVGTVRIFDDSARHAFVYELVGSENLKNAVSLNAVENNVGRALGPAISGVLIAGLGIAFSFLLNALSYVITIYMLTRMREEELGSHTPVERKPGQLLEGFRYVASKPVIRNTLIMMAVIGTFTYEFQVSLPLLAKGAFLGDATSYASLMTMMGVGAIFGGLVSASRRTIAPYQLVVSALALGGSILLTAVMPTLGFAIAGMFLVGFFAIQVTSLANTMIQLEAAPEMRGRVMSLWSTAMGGSTPVGGLIVGVVGEHIGPRWGLIIGGIAALVAGGTAAIVLLRKGTRGAITPQVEINSDEVAASDTRI